MPSITIPTALAIGGAVASAGSAVMGGIAQSDAYNYQAHVARINADIAKNNALYAGASTATNVENASLKAAQKTAGVKAAFAANNLDVNTGSPAAVTESQRELGTIDSATEASKGAQQVYGYESQRESFIGEEAMDKSSAHSALWGGILSGAGSLLGGAAKLPNGTFDWMSGGSDPASPAIDDPEDLGGFVF